MFHLCLYYTILSVPCSFVVTCWKRVALLCVVFPSIIVTFPYGGLGQMWCLVVSIPDLCLLYVDLCYGNKHSNQNRLNIEVTILELI